MWFIILFLMLIQATTAFAGAWTRDPGSCLVTPKIYAYQATKYWDAAGGEHDLASPYQKSEINIYGEYGLTKDNMLVIQTAYDNINDGSAVKSGLADSEIGIVQKIRSYDDAVVSLKGSLIVPSGYSTTSTPLIGYGEIGAEIGLLYGRSWLGGYIDSALGFRKYNGAPSDQLRGNALLGVEINKKIRLKNNLELIWGLGNGRTILVQEKVQTTDSQLLQLDLALEFDVNNRTTVTFGFNKALAGRNTGIGNSYYLGLNYK